MITCKNWHHGWLNEGFASYCEALYIEHVHGFEEYQKYMKYSGNILPSGIYFYQLIKNNRSISKKMILLE